MCYDVSIYPRIHAPNDSIIIDRVNVPRGENKRAINKLDFIMQRKKKGVGKRKEGIGKGRDRERERKGMEGRWKTGRRDEKGREGQKGFAIIS